jgi:hypothetical protein
MRVWILALLFALTGCASWKSTTPPAGSLFIANVDEVTLIPRQPGTPCDATYRDATPTIPVTTCLSNYVGWLRAKLTTERSLFGPKVGKQLYVTHKLTNWKARTLWASRGGDPILFGIVNVSAATDEVEFYSYPLFTMPDGRLAFVPELADGHVFGIDVFPLLTLGSPPSVYGYVRTYHGVPDYASDTYLQFNLVSGDENKPPRKYIKVIYLDDLIKALEAK